MSLLEVKGLKKSFGSSEIIKGIDLNVEKGERIAIIGGSGCGKSVFLRCLSLLETPTAGKVIIDGREITAKGAKVDEIRRSMGMLIVTHEMNFAREVADRVLFFADGGIYEQGTPVEIFDHPKREKTVAFIRKIKYFSFEITDRRFDLMQFHGGIQNFGEKYGLMPKKINRLQICCEELVYEMLAHCYGEDGPVDMQFEVSYAELDQTTEITLDCGGAEYDPFRQDEDGLGVTILKHMASSLDYTRKGNRNLININL